MTDYMSLAQLVMHELVLIVTALGIGAWAGILGLAFELYLMQRKTRKK